MEKQCPIYVPHLINSLQWAFVHPMQSNKKIEISWFAPNNVFLIIDAEIMLICKLLTLNTQPCLKSTPVLDENSTCMTKLSGHLHHIPVIYILTRAEVIRNIRPYFVYVTIYSPSSLNSQAKWKSWVLYSCYLLPTGYRNHSKSQITYWFEDMITQ